MGAPPGSGSRLGPRGPVRGGSRRARPTCWARRAARERPAAPRRHPGTSGHRSRVGVGGVPGREARSPGQQTTSITRWHRGPYRPVRRVMQALRSGHSGHPVLDAGALVVTVRQPVSSTSKCRSRSRRAFAPSHVGAVQANRCAAREFGIHRQRGLSHDRVVVRLRLGVGRSHQVTPVDVQLGKQLPNRRDRHRLIHRLTNPDPVPVPASSAQRLDAHRPVRGLHRSFECHRVDVILSPSPESVGGWLPKTWSVTSAHLSPHISRRRGCPGSPATLRVADRG